MPDKQLTIATYAAGASLAAITLVYVFAPTFFIDEQSASASASTRKKGVVGLSNPANDCFINSVLQSLASLADLRVYLVRETHRRTLDTIDVYTESSENPASKSSPSWKIEGLQQGLVTHGLKEILDALNERPLYKKTISASGFVLVLEKAFRQRISRHQQDAQEFLQVVAERLNDEYHAGHLARQKARAKITNGKSAEGGLLSKEKIRSSSSSLHGLLPKPSELPTAEHQEDWTEEKEAEAPTIPVIQTDDYLDEDGFPLEGTTESQIECLTCGFKPKPSETTFCVLTLNVPQVNSTSISACFDGIFKTEEIEDFKCEKCRLVHALSLYQSQPQPSFIPDDYDLSIEESITRLETAISDDPESPPTDVPLPESKHAPKRKIARHVRITKFPKVLALHLSRSIWGTGASRNPAKVAFPERLPIGGLLDRRWYRLLAVTTHKGSHSSGHYETFRRQASFEPFSTVNPFKPNGAFTKTGSSPSRIPVVREEDEADGESRKVSGENGLENENSTDSNTTPVFLTPDEARSPSLSVHSSSPDVSPSDAASNVVSMDSSTTLQNGSRERASMDSHHSTRSNILRKRFSRNSSSKPTNNQDETCSSSVTAKDSTETSSISSSIRKGMARVSLSNLTRDKSSASTETGTGIGVKAVKRLSQKEEARYRKRKKKIDDRWWRISDEKVRESKTGEVLGMQKEVYLLFYELER